MDDQKTADPAQSSESNQSEQNSQTESTAEDPAKSESAEMSTAEEPATSESAEMSTAEEPATSESSLPCQCPAQINVSEWDKQKKQINKKFYKTYSPRLLFYPFSMAIDVTRAKMGAEKAGYKIPDGAMLVDKGGMFWSTIMLEIEGEGTPNSNVVELNGEYYCKTSARPWSKMHDDLKELEQELGHKPTELWMWYTACPKCIKDDPDKIKTIFLAK